MAAAEQPILRIIRSIDAGPLGRIHWKGHEGNCGVQPVWVGTEIRDWPLNKL